MYEISIDLIHDVYTVAAHLSKKVILDRDHPPRSLWFDCLARERQPKSYCSAASMPLHLLLTLT
jgi:hypothetical protein